MKNVNESGKILLLLTGGTICSFEDEKGERASDGLKAQYKIINNFRESDSPYRNTEFDCVMPLDILSENMTVNSWNILLDFFRNFRNEGRYKGIILLHGTDTLAYTAALLSVLLCRMDIPVIMVSAQLPLENNKTNGNANFRAAAELIMNGIKPNVYAVYRNSDKEIYVHYGSHINNCRNYSNDFYSCDAERINDVFNAKLGGRIFETNEDILSQITSLKKHVLYIAPYTGINYSMYDIEKADAVVHGTYHSETVCVDRKKREGEITENSVLYLMERCRNKNIPFFLAPCDCEAYNYESTGDALACGAYAVSGRTPEMSYIKVLTGCSVGLKGEKLRAFVNKSINYEIIC